MKNYLKEDIVGSIVVDSYLYDDEFVSCLICEDSDIAKFFVYKTENSEEEVLVLSYYLLDNKAVIEDDIYNYMSKRAVEELLKMIP